jgi:hypothetical protein
MINRSLMDALEAGQGQGQGQGQEQEQGQVQVQGQGQGPPATRRTSLFVDSSTDMASEHRKHSHDLVYDKSEICFVVIDNSGSMGGHDGKIFYRGECTEEITNDEPELVMNRREKINKRGTRFARRCIVSSAFSCFFFLFFNCRLWERDAVGGSGIQNAGDRGVQLTPWNPE